MFLGKCVFKVILKYLQHNLPGEKGAKKKYNFKFVQSF